MMVEIPYLEYLLVNNDFLGLGKLYTGHYLKIPCLPPFIEALHCFESL